MKRFRRVILDADQNSAYYHAMTRCVAGADLLDENSREVLRTMIWKVAEFCHVEIVTYAILANHFHVLIHVPQRTEISDSELLRRYELLHPKYSPYMPARIEVIVDWLKRNTPEGKAFREQQLALMFDLSAYMKLLKQRFSIWYNHTHQRFGTLWAERFKSVLVDHDSDALTTMSAYIDLNAIRKGLASDPKDYRWCGYAEALAGSPSARRGLAHVTCESTWTKSHRAYRLLLYSTGSSPRAKGRSIDDKAFHAAMDADGNLPLPLLLRHRWRYFTYGTILGSHGFVRQHHASSPRCPAQGFALPWQDLATATRPSRKQTRQPSP